MEDSFTELRAVASRVLTVFAHPDDLEIFAGGTVARLLESGAEVRTVCMTNGSRGVGSRAIDPDRFGAERELAQRRAAKALGVVDMNVVNLGFLDGGLRANDQELEAIVREIRHFRPDLIITHEPSEYVHGFDADTVWINHRDHRSTARVVFDAVYPFSRDVAFFPDQIAGGLKGHEVHHVMFADAYQHPNRVAINVADQLSKKRRALECFLPDGSVSQEDLEGFMTEGETANGWFEVLGWWRNLH